MRNLRFILFGIVLAVLLTGCERETWPDTGERMCFSATQGAMSRAVSSIQPDAQDYLIAPGRQIGVYGTLTRTGMEDYAVFTKQAVSCGDDLKWTYSPLKFWPNDNDVKVSFFAYAPYVASAPFNKTDALTEAAQVSPAEDGILYIPAADAPTPEIVYRMAVKPENVVDLMYGVDADGLPFLTI